MVPIKNVDTKVLLLPQDSEFSWVNPPEVVESIDWQNDPIGILPFLSAPVLEQIELAVKALNRLAKALPKKQKEMVFTVTLKPSHEDPLLICSKLHTEFEYTKRLDRSRQNIASKLA